MCSLLLQKVVAFLLLLQSDWLTGLEKNEASIFQMASNSFVILKLICNRVILRDLFEKEYHSSVNFHGNPKSRLEIKKFLVDMPIRGGGPILVYTQSVAVRATKYIFTADNLMISNNKLFDPCPYKTVKYQHTTFCKEMIRVSPFFNLHKVP